MPKFLKKQIELTAKANFPDVYRPWVIRMFFTIRDFTNTRGGWFIVFLATAIFFIIGQFFKPSFLQIISVDNKEAKTIIDQRISNLAPIFSISLVVIGWLITNIVIKDTLSYKLLFKRIYLYPIFYFILSLIGMLITFSLIRSSQIINFGDVLTCATYLIVIALILIGFLFVGLTKVVDPGFFFESLQTEVLTEALLNARTVVKPNLGKKIYGEIFNKLLFSNSLRFDADTSGYTKITITPESKKPPSKELTIDQIFGGSSEYQLEDVNLKKITKILGSKNLTGLNYYHSLTIGSALSAGYTAIYIQNGDLLSNKEKKQLRNCYKIKKIKHPGDLSSMNTYLDYLNLRFSKDVKEGKNEYVDIMLTIYEKIYQLEDRINKTM